MEVSSSEYLDESDYRWKENYKKSTVSLFSTTFIVAIDKTSRETRRATIHNSNSRAATNQYREK